MLGAYLCIEEGISPDDAWSMFASLEPGTFAAFRDATFVKSTYDLSILDCLKVRAHHQPPLALSPEFYCDQFLGARSRDNTAAGRIHPATRRGHTKPLAEP